MEYAQIWELCKNDDNPIKVIQRVTGWTEGMAAMQYQRFRKMYLPDDEKNVTDKSKSHWSDEELKLAKDVTLTDDQVGMRIKRTPYAVRKMRNKMGLHKDEQRSSVTDGFEDILSDVTLTNSEVQMRTGLSSSAVSVWRTGHGISGRTIRRKLTVKQRMETLKKHDPELCDEPVVTVPAVKAEHHLKPCAWDGKYLNNIQMGAGGVEWFENGVHHDCPWNRLHDLIDDLLAAEVMHREA